MTALALLLAISAVPECEATSLPHRAALVVCAELAYLASGIEPVTWVALAGKESGCGRRNANLRSSAIGPWQVIARNAGVAPPRRFLLRAWPVNAVAAAKVARGFLGHCGQRWPACYNEGWSGANKGTGDGFLGTVRRMEKQLRAHARHNRKD